MEARTMSKHPQPNALTARTWLASKHTVQLRTQLREAGMRLQCRKVEGDTRHKGTDGHQGCQHTRRGEMAALSTGRPSRPEILHK